MIRNLALNALLLVGSITNTFSSIEPLDTRKPYITYVGDSLTYDMCISSNNDNVRFGAYWCDFDR